jgi:hypothetical protein
MIDATLPSYKREEIIWDSPLTKDEKYTLLALNTFVDGNGECWPGNRRLSKMMSVPVSTMKRYIASLEEKGVVNRDRRYRKDGGETSSKKRVDFEAIAALTPSPPVSHPQPVDEPGGVSTSEPPPSPPVSHQEPSNRNIQKESSHLTTTEQPKKKSSSKRVRDDASLLEGEALDREAVEVAKWMLDTYPILEQYGITLTRRLVDSCFDQGQLDATVAVLALLQAEDSGKLRDAQRFIEDAIAKTWLPSKYWLENGAPAAGWKIPPNILDHIEALRPVEDLALMGGVA